MRLFFVLLLTLGALDYSRPPAAASPTEPLVAQILEPGASSKLWPGRLTDVRIRVETGDQAAISWSLDLGMAGEGDLEELARGSSAVTGDTPVVELAADQLIAGKSYTLTLSATDGDNSATAQVTVLVTKPVYTAIPFSPGNYTTRVYTVYGGDGSGNLLMYSGPVADPAEIVLVDRPSGQRQSAIVALGSSEGVKISSDASRLFYKGTFPRPGTSFTDLGLGFLDLENRTAVLIARNSQYLYSTDADGKRIVYQAPAPDHSTQFFLYDEATGERRQLTDDPDAINALGDTTHCPTLFGSTPLITADGSTVVLITRATLGLVPEDPSLGCHIFTYSVDSEMWRHVAALPSTTTLGTSAVSEDGRWLSFAVSRPLSGGGSRSFPALVDLQTGEVHDPAVDVGNFTSFDSVITGDGRGLVISTEADLDPRVGNADHNMEIFYYDRASGEFSQVTETTGGIGSTPGNCPSYRPYVNRDGSVLALEGFLRFSVELCHLDGPQRNEEDGFWLRLLRIVRRRPGNHPPNFEAPADQQLAAGETLSLEMSATDPDGDPISFFAQLKGGFDVPAGSVITDHHDGTASFRWPTRPEQAGTYVLRMAAFDEGGGEVFHDVTIEVTARAGAEATSTPATTATPTQKAPTITCPGDCDGDGQVMVGELITGVNIALGRAPLTACPAFDCSGAGATIGCLTRAVAASLYGCE